MTTLHAGGKFDHEAYKVSGGLHGVGVSVRQRALRVARGRGPPRRQGLRSRRYERGEPESPISRRAAPTEQTGTTVTFKPDPQIFETHRVQLRHAGAAPARAGVPERAALRITITDERDRQGARASSYEGGIVEFVEHLNQGQERRSTRTPIYFQRARQRRQVGRVEIALQYNDGYAESVFSFANNINTIEGGTHLIGFRSALTRTINDYARRPNGLVKERRRRASAATTCARA